ncbi:putative linoleate 9S-lipoxygenase [Helianthus annuus]|nr:putative linoleate 9S-lipoxygenase [Helianthus annuus]
MNHHHRLSPPWYFSLSITTEFSPKALSLSLITCLISLKKVDGKLGKPAILEEWISTITPLTVGESTYEVTFDWDVEIGLPVAFLIQNLHHSEFYLMTLTLENVHARLLEGHLSTPTSVEVEQADPQPNQVRYIFSSIGIAVTHVKLKIC